MGIQVNIAEAKAKLSELVARAEAGEEVVLARNGEPVVTLTPKKSKPSCRRQLGIWNHLNLQIPRDLFIGPDEETLAAVDGPIFPDRK
ncbi:MAG TPA: type II toxin-antitoxin system prevent-host-death family antitoxin [Phenylobacterium sp.]|nr:type II toxin-antitoxin system prevent-host-death family antitoxin [Phenylobacterium sp.]